MGVRTTRRRQKRKVGGNMHIYVVNQDGDHEPGIWSNAYKTFADALDAVKEYITKLNEKEGYADEIEKSREGSENSGLGVAVAHIRDGTLGHIYIRKVSVS